MTSMEVIWLFLVKMLPLPVTSWLPAHPSPSHPIGVLVVLATTVKTLSKCSYPVYRKHSELAINLWRNSCRQPYLFSRYIELIILKLYF